MPPTTAKKTATEPKDDREMVYPRLTVCGIEIPEEATVVTLARMKEILGYEEMDEKAKGEHLFTLRDGKRVRFTRNTHNRPFDENHARKLAQDLLNRHWQLNGESMIVGQYGETMSIQHRGAALIIACDEWSRQDEVGDHWREIWPEEPVIRSILVCGISEDKEVTRTLDNVKPRSLADVLFSDGDVFSTVSTDKRKHYTKTTDYGIKGLWHRTGVKHASDAYAPIRTHSESLDFLARHPRLLRCVKHIHEQESEKSISGLIPLGMSSSLLYMMGSAASDRAKYQETRDESSLDWSLWDKATDFWTHLSEGDDNFGRVRKAIKYLSREDGEGGGGSTDEKVALIVRAWLCYSAGTPLTDKNLGYEYDESKRMVQNGLKHDDEPDDDGNLLPLGHPERTLMETPSCGGIDLGDPDEAAKEERDRVREEQKAEKQRVKDAEKLLKSQAKLPKEESRSEILDRLHKENPGCVMTWASLDGSHYFAGNDALIVAKYLGGEPVLFEGLQKYDVPKDKVVESMEKLKRAKQTIMVCQNVRQEDGSLKQQAVGEWTPGGYLNKKDDPSPKPAEPVIPTRKAKPVVKLAEAPAAAKPKPAAGTKPKPTLRGGK